MEHNTTMINTNNQSQRVLALVAHRGLLRPKDLDGIHMPRMVLTRLVATGRLERVSRGLYRLPNSQITEHESLFTIATLVPQAVICLLSALQFHELTTQLPRQIWIAAPRGSHAPKISYPPIKMIQYSDTAYSEGIEVVEREKIKIQVYNVEKTIADCFKHRHKIGLDVALEALKEAKLKKKIDMNELWRFAKICRVTNLIRPYLEAIE